MNIIRNSSSPHTVTWTSLPISEESRLKTFILLSVVFSLFFSAWYTFSLSYALIALIMLFISFSRYFFPTSYEIDENGVTVSFLFLKSHHNWNTYLRYIIHSNGIFLTPFKKQSRLENFRGDFLRFNNAIDQKKVLTTIENHIKNE